MKKKKFLYLIPAAIIIFLVMFRIQMAGISSCMRDYGPTGITFMANGVTLDQASICAFGETSINKMESCYKDVQSHTLIPYSFTEKLMTMISGTNSGTLEGFRESQRKQCSN